MLAWAASGALWQAMKGSLLAKTRVLAYKALAFICALVLACSSVGVAGASSAFADEVDEARSAVDSAQAVLDDAEAQMGQITAEYDALSVEVARIQEQIDASIVEVMDAQKQMLEGQSSLSQAALYEYRGGSAATIITLLLESESFTDLLRNVEYVNQVMEYQADEIAAQKARKQHFEELSCELSAQKDAQEQLLSQLEEKRAEAERVVAEANSKLGSAQDAYSSQLEALRAQAEQFKQQAASGGGSIAEGANTVDREEVVPDGTPVQPDPGTSGGGSDAGAGSSGGSSLGGSGSGDAGGSGSSSSGSSSAGGSNNTGGANNAGGSDNSSAAGWLTGTASAYGGSTDPYTPNPGITATGAVCDDWSMGVAVPMSMPNYRSYFGRTVEITYAGKTVYAVVNDCGYMGGGSRVLDLQPGVWKAFGYSSCRAWGLRTVTYRFL